MRKKFFQLLIGLLCLHSMQTVAQSDTNIRNFRQTKVTTDGTVAYVRSDELNDLWKSSYKYALVVPADAGLWELTTLGVLLEKKDGKPRFTWKNTLLVCPAKYVDSLKEISGKFRIFVCDSRFLDTDVEVPQVVQASVKKMKKKAFGEYDYRFVKEKVY